MPCSQMISMNCMPPRATEASAAEMLPAAKARIRNRPRLNMGSATRVSITAKAASNAHPAASSAMTSGLPQPIACFP